MLIINDSVSLGDTLFTFPVMAKYCEQARARNEQIYATWTNKDVGELFPNHKYGVKNLRELPDFTNQSVVKLCFHDMVRSGVKHRNPKTIEHPTNMFLTHHGFGDFPTPVAPEIEFLHKPTIEYDFIIAPFVMYDPARAWLPDRWQSLINRIHQNAAGARIGIIAGTKFPNRHDMETLAGHVKPTHINEKHIESNTHRNFTGVEFIYDRPLTEIANLMYHVKKAVITVDSGPARLKHAVGKTPHILLCHNSIGKMWGSYPEAITIYDRMTNISVDRVWQEVAKLL